MPRPVCVSIDAGRGQGVAGHGLGWHAPTMRLFKCFAALPAYHNVHENKRQQIRNFYHKVQ